MSEEAAPPSFLVKIGCLESKVIWYGRLLILFWFLDIIGKFSSAKTGLVKSLFQFEG